MSADWREQLMAVQKAANKVFELAVMKDARKVVMKVGL
jgi:hypothetical protein